MKKFVDQGVDFFKQDGANQVGSHPDRLWGNGKPDSEIHNLYPLLYSRQMYEGFEAYTSRRLVIFTPCGWTGFQAWAGTWTGDTGGRLTTLAAMLNTSIVLVRLLRVLHRQMEPLVDSMMIPRNW